MTPPSLRILGRVIPGIAQPREADARPVLAFEMVWICGTSVGTALFSAVAAARAGAPKAFNPLHTGPGTGYSDAFLALAVPLLALLAVSFMLRGRGWKRRPS